MRNRLVWIVLAGIAMAVLGKLLLDLIARPTAPEVSHQPTEPVAGPLTPASPDLAMITPTQDSPTAAASIPLSPSEDPLIQSAPTTIISGASGVVSIDPEDPRRFVIDGKPLYLAGYYPAIAALTADQTDYEGYYKEFIDTLSAQGINFFRNVFTMGQPYGESMTVYLRTGPGEASDGRAKFDLDQFNQAYFDYWREVITYAQSKEIVVQLTIFDNWHNKRWVVTQRDDPRYEWGMKHDFYNGANNINGVDVSDIKDWHDPDHPVFEYQKALVRAVVDAVGDLPNIIFEISNENYTSEEWELLMADYLSEYEAARGFPQHLVMPRDLPNHSSAGGSKNNPKRVRRELLDNFSLNQPLIADNDGGGEVDPDTRRKKAWAALTAGGHVSYFNWELFKLDVLRSQDALEGMRYIGLTRQFLEEFSIDLRGMTPKDDLVSNGWCYAKPGERYIIYLISGGNTRVSGLPEFYEAVWFNPRDGSSQPANGGPSFRAPDRHDWVLYLEAQPMTSD